MKKAIYIALFLCTVFALEGMAQTAKSAYFLDGTFHNFKLNPAMKAERGFFSVGLGNMTIGANSNVGISDFLYPQGNKLTTFMSGDVDQAEFLGRLPESIRLGLNFDETLLAFGFRMFGGYTSFSLSTHTSTSMALPKGFFELAKTGLQQSSFNFSGINMSTMNYAAATLGYSHEVYKGLRVGVNLKYLVGLAYADLTFDRFNVELSEERWMVEAHARAQAALFYEANPSDFKPVSSFAPTAKGFAVDLGVVYDMKEFVPGLTLSASLLDLGKINWKYTMSLENDGTPLVWTGLNDIDLNDMGSALKSELDKLGEDAKKMYDYKEFKINDIESTSAKLGATMYLGAEYNMPFFNPLSVAVLYGKKFSTYSGWDEVRGFVNFAPFKWIEASANIGKTTFGTSWGWMFNFHPGFTSFFIGSDYMLHKVTPQFIPVNDLNYHITLGVNMPIGKRDSDKGNKRQSQKETKSTHSTTHSTQTIVIYKDITLPVLSVTLNESADTLTAVNDTLQLTAVVTPDNATNKAVTWSSSNDSVAIVDNNGFVTAVGNGIAIITATADEQTATCEITVAIEATEETANEVTEEVVNEVTEEAAEEVTANTTEESTEEAIENPVIENDNTDSSLQ